MNGFMTQIGQKNKTRFRSKNAFSYFFIFSRFPLKSLAFFAQFSSRSPPQTKRRKTASKIQLLSNSRLRRKNQCVCLMMVTIPKIRVLSCLISRVSFFPGRPAWSPSHKIRILSCLMLRVSLFTGWPDGRPLMRGRRLNKELYAANNIPKT